jgi:hypothetical protein
MGSAPSPGTQPRSEHRTGVARGQRRHQHEDHTARRQSVWLNRVSTTWGRAAGVVTARLDGQCRRLLILVD